MKNEKLGFIGIGQMGKFMVRNLKKEGYDVHVFDVDRSAMEEMKKSGISTSPSCREMALAVDDTIMIMVRTSQQVRHVMFGDEGIASSGRKNLDIIITSTTSPSFAKELGEDALNAGYRMINAPVSGASHGAEKGTLSLMVSGDEELYKKSKPIFDAIGKKVFYFGSMQESGQGAKLANNLTQAVNVIGTIEGFRFAASAGIPEEQFQQLISVSTGGSWASENWEWTKRLTEEADSPEIQGLLALMYKDIHNVISESTIPLPMLGLAAQLFLAKNLF
jgi:3-hydroxyisobutyrate dehydrogenase-like beta-hydroxyacid dehydrogenase